MTLYIITVKLKHLIKHDPKVKLTGICRVKKSQCTDITGEHHSFLHVEDDYRDPNNIKRVFEQKGFHVTRVEVA